MSSGERTLRAIVYERGSPLRLLDQTKLPFVFQYLDINTATDAFDAIVSMAVRGAPAIAVAAALAVAVELAPIPAAKASSDESWGSAQMAGWIVERLDYLLTSRPTAVNLRTAVDDLRRVVREAASVDGATVTSVAEAYRGAAEAMLAADTNDNAMIAEHGSEFIRTIRASVLQQNAENGTVGGRKLRILTHCNTGSLATVLHGTALGVVRFLHRKGLLERVYCTETRPYNQGARLSSFEMVYEGIPVTLVVDSAASSLMRAQSIDAVVVGADRVCANGDTANKIGTYQLSIAAKHHGVPFFVAAPLTSVDLGTSSGEHVVIEERDPREITHQRVRAGNDFEWQRVVVEGVEIWNPSFDVAPGSLITGIITEKGVVVKKEGSDVFDMQAFVDSVTKSA